MDVFNKNNSWSYSSILNEFKKSLDKHAGNFPQYVIKGRQGWSDYFLLFEQT